MAIDFFASARFRMKIPDGVTGVGGGLIMPAAIPLHTLARRGLDRKFPHLARRLLDPQLYLGGLPANSCRKACVNLSTYSWFKTDQSSFASSRQTQAEWKDRATARIHSVWQNPIPTAAADIDRALRACLELQSGLECEALVLPSPLTVDLASDYSLELRWLDRGATIAHKIAPTLPILATLAISDTCLRPMEPWANPLLDIIIDQLTARGFGGVYLTLELANENGYYCTHPNTVGAMLRVVDALGESGSRVVVAFAGVMGLLAVASGADTWSTGWYRGERRLKLADFEDQTGRAHPTYYSHPLASEIHLESDLDRLVKAGMLNAIADTTSASERLLKALRAGRSAGSVADWAYLASNVNAAQTHFLSAVIRETEKLRLLGREGRRQYARNWLEQADRLATELYKIGSFHQRTELSHQSAWKAAYDRYLSRS